MSENIQIIHDVLAVHPTHVESKIENKPQRTIVQFNPIMPISKTMPPPWNHRNPRVTFASIEYGKALAEDEFRSKCAGEKRFGTTEKHQSVQIRAQNQ